MDECDSEDSDVEDAARKGGGRSETRETGN